MADDSGEKTFDPTAKRKREAVEGGDVLRSRELTIATGTAVGITWMIVAGPWLMRGLMRAMRLGFSWDRASLDRFEPGALLRDALGAVLPPVFLLGVLVLAASLFVQLGLGDGAFVAANLAPKPSRLNPAKGLSRMFGVHGLIEIGKGLAKLALLGGLSWGWARSRLAPLIGLGAGQLHAQLGFAWNAISMLLVYLAVGLMLIAMSDYPIQWVRRRNRLRMSRQDVRDEQKQTDGNPQNKAAVRRRQRAIARGSARKAVQKAQLVITNPTHFAIAMSYDPDIAPAPVVTAKGRGETALAIRELAAEFGVPVLEYPALARSVYYTTRENQVIREELYVAVAAVLAFVMSLRRGESPPAPRVDVPLSVRFDADGNPEITAEDRTAAP
ncbi:flagellar biosynthesis protein FlhB [Novosphingobium sp. FSW06-99]|uniref:EscU/YscU/HrcU family type III secretion system export apparatus switch protein n=1 Tax=Novosphingobium sp. FSW06-99 TaxID=1739113 RepID=UPI00076CE3E3|nr:EscU/YscU/HrcU family type III secretion system export apparatus switch protein [Novosphingobium sp. FSW06-99]KUR70973.1 flagellar biosynthesis protein [Novosphingobium sp. FSW06-99]